MKRESTEERDLGALLDALEAPELDAEVNLASGFKRALHIIGTHPLVRAVIQSCRRNPRLVAALLDRLKRLGREKIDPAYASPYDSALFALLFALDQCEPFKAYVGAKVVIEAPGTWWASKLARRLLEDLTPDERTLDELLSPAQTTPDEARAPQRCRTSTRPVEDVRFEREETLP